VNSVINASLILAGVVAVLTVTVIVTGLHEQPAVGIPLFIFGAIFLNIVVVFWGLKQTAAEDPYGKQLTNAALIGLIGGVLIFVVSIVMTGVLFPDFLDESKAAQAGLLESTLPAGPTLDEALARNASRSPLSEAFGGLVGTLGTSILAGAIIGIFLRRK
jgi:hypothetical protein